MCYFSAVEDFNRKLPSILQSKAGFDPYASFLQAYKRAVTSNPSQLTGWQGLVKLYEKLLIGSKEDLTTDRSNRSWNLDDVVFAYRTILSIYSQTAEIEKYIVISAKLVQLYQSRLKTLDDALNTLSERIAFLQNQTNERAKINDAYVEMVRLISSEAQISEISEENNATLCNALEKVIIQKRLGVYLEVYNV